MGRFARRVKAWATMNGVPVIYCKAGECKHLIAEEHPAAHPPSRPGVFLVLAPAAGLVTATRSTGPEYSRNLRFRSGAQMEDLFDRVCDRTWSRLDIPARRTLFGLKNRPHHNRAAGPPAQEAVIENFQYGLTWFRIHFGLAQQLKRARGLYDPPGRLRPAQAPR